MVRPTTRSYAGRQLDIELLKHVEEMKPKQRVGRDVAFEYDEDGNVVDIAPRIVSGIEKTVQRYAKLFLTATGSVRANREIGNDLLESVLTGQVSNMAYFNHLYTLADLSAKEAMRADDEREEFGSIPDDERLVRTELVDIDLDYLTATAKIHVFLETAAGDSFTFVIPVESGIN